MRRLKEDRKGLSAEKKLQLGAAIVFTLICVIGIPVYSWFRAQREIARFERIDSPDALYITAAHKENSIYMKMGGIDVTAFWRNSDGELTEQQVDHKDYVFTVAGNYVTYYTLQLAHTTNNKYTYQIYEADVTTVPPGNDKIEGRDYVIYTAKNDIPKELSNIPDHGGETIAKDTPLYYSIKKDAGGNPVLVEGTYLNRGDNGLANSQYHEKTYEYDHVEAHAEPLYWQATHLSGGEAGSKAAFYHEYILRVSWETDENSANVATSDYKDTDLVCLTAKAN